MKDGPFYFNSFQRNYSGVPNKRVMPHKVQSLNSKSYQHVFFLNAVQCLINVNSWIFIPTINKRAARLLGTLEYLHMLLQCISKPPGSVFHYPSIMNVFCLKQTGFGGFSLWFIFLTSSNTAVQQEIQNYWKVVYGELS